MAAILKEKYFCFKPEYNLGMDSFSTKASVSEAITKATLLNICYFENVRHLEMKMLKTDSLTLKTVNSCVIIGSNNLS